MKRLQRATSLLEEKGLDQHAAKLLMAFITQKTSANLLADLREPLTETEHNAFWDKTRELLTGKPVQYIIGHESFTATHSKSMKMSSFHVRKRKNSFMAHWSEEDRFFLTKQSKWPTSVRAAGRLRFHSKKNGRNPLSPRRISVKVHW